MHLNQVHKETLEYVENALPNRQGLEVEIFGMEGIPQEVLENHRNRLVQNFYQAQEDRRLATGNPLPGQAKHQRKKIRIETAEELKKRLAEWRAKRHEVPAPAAPEQTHAPYSYGNDAIPARPQSTGLPQRPGAAGDVPSHEAEAPKTTKKDKDKKGRMFYDDADTSPEERMAALPRYAFVSA